LVVYRAQRILGIALGAVMPPAPSDVERVVMEREQALVVRTVEEAFDDLCSPQPALADLAAKPKQSLDGVSADESAKVRLERARHLHEIVGPRSTNAGPLLPRRSP
jgi:hypothetical protein